MTAPATFNKFGILRRHGHIFFAYLNDRTWICLMITSLMTFWKHSRIFHCRGLLNKPEYKREALHRIPNTTHTRHWVSEVNQGQIEKYLLSTWIPFWRSRIPAVVTVATTWHHVQPLRYLGVNLCRRSTSVVPTICSFRQASVLHQAYKWRVRRWIIRV
jgi:hypothetical protein